AAQAAPQLALRLAEASAAGVSRIAVDLRPPELGRIELRLTFQEGGVHVLLRAEQPETFEALRQDRQTLLTQMEQAGVQLGTGGLDLQQGTPGERRDTPSPAAAAPLRGMAEAEAEDIAAPPRRVTDSLIDIIA
ncbi:flagellar hook-length control protein FliK, partial [Teichococcus aerofrigidensis]